MYNFYLHEMMDLYVFFGMLLATAIAVRCTGWFCDTVVRDYFSAYVLRDAPFNHPLSKPAAHAKFIGTAWQFLIHFTMTIFEVYVLYEEDWISVPWTCFDPDPDLFTPKASLRFLFVTQMAIWIYTCFSHRFNASAHAHKDYFVMYVHHIITIGLVGIAYYDNNFKIGAVVLFVHDASDIAIDVLKMANYLRLDSSKAFFFVETAYAVLMGCWCYFRLYLFPRYIITHGSFVSIAYWENRRLPDGSIPLANRMLYRVGHWTKEYNWFFIKALICNILLCMLLCLHFWWFALLIRLLRKICANGGDAHGAGAAEYEGDSDHEHDDDESGHKKQVQQQQTAAPSLKEAGKKMGAAVAEGGKSTEGDEDDDDEPVRVGLPTRRKLGKSKKI